MQQATSRMVSRISLLGSLCCLLLMSGLLEASSLVKVKKPEGNHINIDSFQAHDFLTHSRPKRNVDPKWHRGNPDFQSYYRYYNSIGHIEGLYEIDRIRMLYQQMRHLELAYGPDASSYQNVLGVLTSTAAPTTATTTTATTTTTQPPPPTTAAPTADPLKKAQRFYLCHPKDPLCKPQIVYLPSGAVPALCDPRLHTCSAKTEEEIKAVAPPETPPPPPAPKKADPPPPPAIVFKGMEYDCDPYWDPDCLIDHPPRPMLGTVAPEPPAKEEEKEEVKVEEEEKAPSVPATQKAPSPHFDPYDFNRDLFDPLRYTHPAPDAE